MVMNVMALALKEYIALACCKVLQSILSMQKHAVKHIVNALSPECRESGDSAFISFLIFWHFVAELCKVNLLLRRTVFLTLNRHIQMF